MNGCHFRVEVSALTHSNSIAETSSGCFSAPRPAPKKLKERGNQGALLHGLLGIEVLL